MDKKYSDEAFKVAQIAAILTGDGALPLSRTDAVHLALDLLEEAEQRLKSLEPTE